MSFKSRIRGNRAVGTFVGALLVYLGYAYEGAARMWTAKFQIGETILGVGAFLAGYSLATLYRRKGDYDDLDEPADAGDDDLWKEPGARR